MTGQEQPEIKTEKEILESYDFDSDIIDQLDNFGNKLWVSAQSEIKFLEEIHNLLMFQFEKMRDLRLMHQEVRDIKDNHWHYLYLGNLSEMQMKIEQRIKQLKEGKEK